MWTLLKASLPSVPTMRVSWFLVMLFERFGKNVTILGRDVGRFDRFLLNLWPNRMIQNLNLYLQSIFDFVYGYLDCL